MMIATVIDYLAPRGVLRAWINLGDPVLAQAMPEAPGGVTVDLAREVAASVGLEADFTRLYGETSPQRDARSRPSTSPSWTTSASSVGA
jgi:hypothetical protein